MFDIPQVGAVLPTGAGAQGKGDNAAAVVADKDSGATGAAGEDVAAGVAVPGFALGFGSEFKGVSAGATPENTGLFGSLFQ